MNPATDFPHDRSKAWLLPVVIGLLAFTASLSGVGNDFAQDDLALIFQNPRMHTLGSIPSFFTDPYWPPPFVPALYRPFASVGLALEWAVGGGSPLGFRLVSYLLYAFASVAFLQLARRCLPMPAAVAAAALFAVHPVHVESVAVAVNQSEVWVGLLACLMVAVYLRTRSAGGPMAGKTQLVLAGLYLSACAFKENALVIPGILVAAELLLVRDPAPLGTRIATLRQPFLLLALVAVAFYGVRTLVLSGSLSGTFSAEALVGLTLSQRALTMLAVVPHWFRLLYWPAHLRADYSPGELVAQTAWGSEQTLGLAILLGAALTLVLAWRRAPIVGFGLAWCAIALFPVHNVFVPTGILLAERTLFLPSVGAMLVLGGIGTALLERGSRPVQVALASATAVLLVLGMLRTGFRHPVWRDQFRLWYHTANVDAPRSFRAHEALADKYFRVGVEAMAEAEYRIAMTYAPPTFTRPFSAYADRLRMRGHCYPASRIYRDVLGIRPENSAIRAALVACLLDLGWYREAMFHARMGIAYEWSQPVFQWALGKADSAWQAKAPPGSVRVIMNPADTVAAYMQVGPKK